MNKRKKVIHVLPRDGLGGAEAAARSALGDDSIDVLVWFVTGPPTSGSRVSQYLSPDASINSISAYKRLLIRLVNEKPDLMVLSLWRCSLFALAVKLIRPRQKFALMLHSTRYAHFVDQVVTKLWMRLSDEIWSDSEETAAVMVPESKKHKIRTLNFVVRVPDSASRAGGGSMVFWGRIVKKKSVPRAVRIFSLVNRFYPSLRFLVFGPDAGDLNNVRAEIQAWSLNEHVCLRGPINPGEFPSDLVECGFFIMPSTHEGMAVAVVEAMQLGLVPVVTPVGQMSNYCRDGYNSIIINSDDDAASKVLSVLETPGKWAELSRNAMATWEGVELYDASFRKATIALLEGKV